ncbi:hypothetical protein PTSG_13016 [Salpingoeca rosetta]|uniref:Uncharacterized protein n=1 Tax=Salpingoeca rosetta (strain ATCC 50818 / BSB-021) TaxID=946362 RepID=F2UQU0_SALR5|nr:uncharacterized protein PTSG_13016 [Salpingoeca rosetta]EGD79995.1 hypothetical protein PTSG_13016 [Salpingoeca rosetta]|eukprot:XP_004988616.1 hypothetical protein PTSG_13016 [Salpingoeca rosetta]
MTATIGQVHYAVGTRITSSTHVAAIFVFALYQQTVTISSLRSDRNTGWDDAGTDVRSAITTTISSSSIRCTMVVMNRARVEVELQWVMHFQ